MKRPNSRFRRSVALCAFGFGAVASVAIAQPVPPASASARPFAEGIISTPLSFGASFSPDGQSFYFSRVLPPRGLPTLMRSRLRGKQWTAPEVVPIDGASGEGDASLSPDGARLFFWSRRTAPGKPAGSRPIPDLWFVEQRDGRFGPVRSVGETDTAAWTPLSLGHGGPSVAADGTLYAFRGAAATGGSPRLVRARLVAGRYPAFEDLGEALNANGGGFDPYIAPDQRYLVFSSDRADSHGKADLYLSLRTADGGWSTPRNLGPAVNSDASEYEPAISPDGRLLVFTRDQRGIFVIETSVLGLDLSPGTGPAAGDAQARLEAPANGTAAALRAKPVDGTTGRGGRPIPEAALFEDGLISTSDSFAATFTPDGKTLFFCRSSGARPNRRSTILVSRHAAGRWSAPQAAPFSGEFNDFDPTLSPDGKQLFFASVRPESGPRPAFWVVEHTAAGWSTPRSLGVIAGTDAVTVFPCPTASGNLYFAGHATGLASQGDDDIYVCRRHSDGSYGPPENLGPAVNSPYQDYDGYVAPDESFIIFCSRRPGGIGPSDFYLSTRENGGWSPARNLGPLINSASARGVCCPSVSPDRQWFYFTSSRDERPGIYRIEFEALGLPPRASAAAPAAPAPRPAGGQAAPAPVLFGGGAVKGSCPTFSPDGATVFTHLYNGAEKKHAIMVSQLRDGRWTPSEVAPFSGVHDDMEPALSTDGRRLVFASRRPAAATPDARRLWCVEQTDTGWSESKLLPMDGAAADAPSGAPSLAPDGALYFGHLTARGWPWEIYSARYENGRYAEPVRLNDAVNPGGRSWSHSIAPDQSFLIFAGVIDAQTPRADSLGDIDLFVSFRVNGRWQPGVNLGPVVNTKEAEVWPRISRDGRDLFFNRQGPDARGIYQIKLEPLLAPLRPKTSAGAWSRLPDIPTARLAAGAVAFNGEIYVIGGCVVRDRAAHPIAAVEVFSPATSTWTTKAPLPTPRSNFGIAIAGGRIFVIGGTFADNLSETDVVEAYDPVTDHWTRAASLPTARCQVGATTVGGKIYAIGGNRHHEQAFEVYDPATDRWSKLPSLEAPRRDAGVVAMDGKIYVAVGLGADARNPLSRLQVYDPATQRWSELAAAQRPRCDSALVALGSSVVAVGGWNRGPIAMVEAYDPTSDSWRAHEPLPVPTQFHCAAVLEDRIYVFGGSHQLPTATSDAYVWAPITAR